MGAGKYVLTILLALMLVGCAGHKPAPANIVYRDRVVYRDHVARDTVRVKDSVCVRSQSDTVYYYKLHTEYVDRIRIDTAYVSRIDSVYVRDVVKEKYIPNIYRYSAFVCWGLIILFVCVIIARLKKLI